MFVPKFIYEKAPFYWIILGVLLIVIGTYYGKMGDPIFFAAGIGGGAIACVWGLVVFGRRLSRQERQPCESYDDYLDQTCELNLRMNPIRDPAASEKQD
jgi:hypothetical protein